MMCAMHLWNRAYTRVNKCRNYWAHIVCVRRSDWSTTRKNNAQKRKKKKKKWKKNENENKYTKRRICTAHTLKNCITLPTLKQNKTIASSLRRALTRTKCVFNFSQTIFVLSINGTHMICIDACYWLYDVCLSPGAHQQPHSSNVHIISIHTSIQFMHARECVCVCLFVWQVKNRCARDSVEKKHQLSAFCAHDSTLMGGRTFACGLICALSLFAGNNASVFLPYPILLSKIRCWWYTFFCVHFAARLLAFLCSAHSKIYAMMNFDWCEPANDFDSSE